MNEEQLQVIEEKMSSVIDDLMTEKLKEIVGQEVALATKNIVKDLRVQRAIYGKDMTGLDEKQKKDFVEVIKNIALRGSLSGIDIKANEALIEEQDNRGGYLVSTEVANAILRIAASVGLVLSQARKWPMATDELDIPAYTGSFLEGEYLGVDAAGNVTAITFDQAKLIAKKWQLAFVLGNDVLADASVSLADWLLALGGEALANMIDKQAFAGTGAPFVGILNHSGVTVYNMPTGETAFSDFKVIDDSSDVIANLEESVLPGSAFYMNRTVWAKLRVQKDTAGNYLLPQAGAVSAAVLANNPTGGGVKPAGEIMGFPVFTTRHLPANSASAVSTKFMVFGNLSALAYGDKGQLRVAQHDSGSFGGKEIALADQRGLVYKHRHALVAALPSAFVAVETAAS